MRRTRKQWAELRNEQRVIAECRALVDAGEARWREPFELLSAIEALGLERPRRVAQPLSDEQLRLEVSL